MGRGVAMAGRRLATWIFVLFVGIVPATADDWYVDNVSGNDRLSGNTESQPLKSIQTALLRAKLGDRIILKASDVPYREALSVTGTRNSGFRGRPFEIVGNGAILDGSEPIPEGEWEALGGDLFRVRPPQISYQRLFLNQRPLEKVTSPRNLESLKPLQWTQRDGWIIVRTDPGRAPYQYAFSCCRRAVGVTLYDCHDVQISQLTVQGFQFDGISIPDRAMGVVLGGCVFRGNGRSGINCGGAARVLVSDSLLGDNGESQIRSEGFCRMAIDSCELLEQPGILSIDHQGGVVLRDGQSVQP